MNPESYRTEFPHIEEGIIYLNHAAVSPMSNRVRQALEHFMDHRQVANIEFWPNGLEEKQALKADLAKLLHLPAEQFAIVPNTSTGLNILAQGLSWKPGDRILLNNFEFPANVYPFLNLERKGVVVDFVPHRDGRILLEDIEAAIRPETRLLSISFVEFLNGFKNDLYAIGELCKQHNIWFAVDGIQGIGVQTLDVTAAGIDFLAVGGQKWLMWPLGTAFIWISKRLFPHLHPAFLGWLAVEDSWNFFDYRMDLLPDAGRFEPGTMNVMGIIGARAAMQPFLELGIETIEQHLLQLTDYLADELQAMGFSLLSDRSAKHRSQIVTFRTDNGEALFQALQKHNIRVSLREGNIRVSPHFYNTREEIDQFLQVLKKLK